MLLLGVGALCSFGQDATRYFFQPRVTAEVSYCSARLCDVDYGGSTSVSVAGGPEAGLATGQAIRVYEIDDDHVRLADAGPPWTVWLFGVLALVYLVAVAVRIAQATATRRAALARGEDPRVVGEFGVVAWWVGPPLIVLGGLLAFGEHSRAAGWVVIVTGLITVVGFSTLWVMANRARAATPQQDLAASQQDPAGPQQSPAAPQQGPAGPRQGPAGS